MLQEVTPTGQIVLARQSLATVSVVDVDMNVLSISIKISVYVWTLAQGQTCNFRAKHASCHPVVRAIAYDADLFSPLNTGLHLRSGTKYFRSIS
jgi:hypothetical protein